MPNTLAIKATTRLFSWMRQGLHAGLAAARTDVADGHLAVPMRVRVNNLRDVDVPVKLYGPGDVTGVDPREVIRTDPHHLLGDFEPNYFPLSNLIVRTSPGSSLPRLRTRLADCNHGSVWSWFRQRLL